MSDFELVRVLPSHPHFETLFQQAMAVFCRERQATPHSRVFSQLSTLWLDEATDFASADCQTRSPGTGDTALPESLAERWRQALVLNPSGGALNPGCFWLARRKGYSDKLDKVPLLGVLLGVPCQVVGTSRTLPGHWGVDLYVPPSVRGQGIGEALLMAWRDSSPLALGLGITDSAFRLEQKLGWTVVPLPPQLRLPLSPVGLAGVLAQQLRAVAGAAESPRARARAGAEALRRTLEKALQGSGGTAPHTEEPSAGARGGAVAPLMPTPVEALALAYQRTRPALGLHLERNAAVLAFMYASHLGFQGFALPESGDGVVLRPERRGGVLRWWLYELFWDAAEPASLDRLVASVIHKARQERVDVLGLRCTLPPLRHALLSRGFVEVGAPERFIVHRAEACGPLDERMAPDRETPPDRVSLDWHLTLGDSGNRASVPRGRRGPGSPS